MNFKTLTLAAAVAAALTSVSLPAFSMGAVGGPVVRYASIQGELGEVIVNPNKVAPLTAVIKNGGYDLESAEVTIVPKKGGQEIKYKVSKAQLLTNAGIPVFGLYGGYRNEVKVSCVISPARRKPRTKPISSTPTRSIGSTRAPTSKARMTSKPKSKRRILPSRIVSISSTTSRTKPVSTTA